MEKGVEEATFCKKLKVSKVEFEVDHKGETYVVNMRI